MSQFLLNRNAVPFSSFQTYIVSSQRKRSSVVVCNINNKNKHVERLNKYVKKVEERKLETMKQTFNFMKDMGEKDVQYFRNLHNELLNELENDRNDKKNSDDDKKDIIEPDIIIDNNHKPSVQDELKDLFE